MPPQNQSASPASPGKSNKLLISTIVLGVLFLAALVFGVWAFQGRQNYKNNADRMSADAAAAAKKSQADQDQASFNDQLKKPYKSFSGPSTYGSIKFSYPKSWSAYVDQTSSSEPINAYFYPGEVPGTSGNTAYALRAELTTTSYSTVVQQYQTQIEQGDLKASAYVPLKLAKTGNVQRGTKVVGTLSSSINGAMIIIPVRSQTLQLYTQSTDFIDDFNNIVLPSLTFSP